MRSRRKRETVFWSNKTPPPLFIMDARQIIIKAIGAKDANNAIKKLHYSGTVVPNSQLHLGVFIENKLEGVMQFGSSMRKDLIMPLVSGTKWSEFIELNRMAFSDKLPRNSESRALSIALRMIKKHSPFIKWVVTFADATQCGDGTIYRACGFVLTGIKRNSQLAINPETKKVMHKISAFHIGKEYEHSQWEKLDGFQLRYIYFLDPTYRARLTVPELPYSEIKARGATMYKGQRPTGVQGVAGGTPDSNLEAEVRDLPARSNTVITQ